MATIRTITARACASTVAAVLITLPGLAAALPQASGDGVNGGAFSAPEIEIALVSSAVLVAGGAALILRDRKARRKLDDPE